MRPPSGSPAKSDPSADIELLQEEVSEGSSFVARESRWPAVITGFCRGTRRSDHTLATHKIDGDKCWWCERGVSDTTSSRDAGRGRHRPGGCGKM